MLVIDSPGGKTYPQAPLETGSFDWRRIGFTAHIPADATAITLVLGLEQVTGKVWFDDVRFTVAKAPLREWSGWSVEHGSEREDTKPASSPTDRQRLLCKWFAQNQKPRW